MERKRSRNRADMTAAVHAALCEIAAGHGFVDEKYGNLNFRTAQITTLTIPEGIYGIGVGAFGLCRSLKELTLPATLKKIAPRAFLHADGLKEVVIPKNVETVYENSFPVNCKLVFGGVSAAKSYLNNHRKYSWLIPYRHCIDWCTGKLIVPQKLVPRMTRYLQRHLKSLIIKAYHEENVALLNAILESSGRIRPERFDEMMNIVQDNPEMAAMVIARKRVVWPAKKLERYEELKLQRELTPEDPLSFKAMRRKFRFHYNNGNIVINDLKANTYAWVELIVHENLVPITISYRIYNTDRYVDIDFLPKPQIAGNTFIGYSMEGSTELVSYIPLSDPEDHVHVLHAVFEKPLSDDISADDVRWHRSYRTVVFPEYIGGRPVTEIRGIGYDDIGRVILPKTVKKLGVRAFSGAHNLQSIVGLRPDIELGYDALRHVYSLAGPDGIIRINGITFGCTPDGAFKPYRIEKNEILRVDLSDMPIITYRADDDMRMDKPFFLDNGQFKWGKFPYSENADLQPVVWHIVNRDRRFVRAISEQAICCLPRNLPLYFSGEFFLDWFFNVLVNFIFEGIPLNEYKPLAASLPNGAMSRFAQKTPYAYQFSDADDRDTIRCLMEEEILSLCNKTVNHALGIRPVITFMDDYFDD